MTLPTLNDADTVPTTWFNEVKDTINGGTHRFNDDQALEFGTDADFSMKYVSNAQGGYFLLPSGAIILPSSINDVGAAINQALSENRTHIILPTKQYLPTTWTTIQIDRDKVVIEGQGPDLSSIVLPSGSGKFLINSNITQQRTFLTLLGFSVIAPTGSTIEGGITLDNFTAVHAEELVVKRFKENIRLLNTVRWNFKSCDISEAKGVGTAVNFLVASASNSGIIDRCTISQSDFEGLKIANTNNILVLAPTIESNAASGIALDAPDNCVFVAPRLEGNPEGFKQSGTATRCVIIQPHFSGTTTRYDLNARDEFTIIDGDIPLLIPRLTTAERDALSVVNGYLIYNTTDNKFQGRENGAWVNLV